MTSLLVQPLLVDSASYAPQADDCCNNPWRDLQDKLNRMIAEQGEDAQCAAWIYTKEDIYRVDEDGEFDYFALDNPELVERVFDDVGNIDYIYQVIQECVDEVAEEQFVQQQQELV